MESYNSDYTAGFKKVVFENVVDMLAGGAAIDPDSATAFTATGIIPAGTAISVLDSGTGYHSVVAIGTSLVPDILGLLAEDLPLDDMPLANVVLSGTVRTAALPTAEAAGIALIKAALYRFTFV